jgi:hypothetical protein
MRRLVHDHCYRIMKYAADEIMSADQAERAAEFWTGARARARAPV